MVITKELVAEKLGEYLRHELSLAEIVDWAETALMESEFAARDADQLRQVVARLGLADVQAFGLTWEDCEDMLKTLGFSAHVEIVSI